MGGKSSTIKVTIVGDADGLKKAFGQAGDSAEKFESKASSAFSRVGSIATGVLAAQGVRAALDFGKELYTLGGSLDSMSKKADTVFGAQASSMRAWSDQVNESLGMSKERTLDMATSMADLLKPMGFTEEAAGTMSKEMIGLSGALSAWSNGQKSSAEVSDIMTKAMLGERDGLKQLGISISEADVTARVAANGQSELTGAALAQAKAIATQQLILEKSTDAQKAWNDGSMENAKRQNEVKAKLDEAKTALAAGLFPVFQSFLTFTTTQLIPGITALSGFVAENKEYFLAAAIGIGVMLIPAFIGWAVAAGAAAVATIAATWPVLAIGVAIAGLAAGVIYAYEHFGWFRAAVDTVGAGIQWLWSWITNNWPTLLAVLTGPFGVAVLLITKNWDTIKEGATAAKDWIVNKFNEIKDFFTGLPGRITGAIGNMRNLLTNIGRDIINGLWNGLKDKWEDVKGWLGNVGGVIKSIKGPIEADRVLLKPEGQAIMEGLGAGMAAGWGPVAGFLDSREQAIQAALAKWKTVNIPLEVQRAGYAAFNATGMAQDYGRNFERQYYKDRGYMPQFARGGIVTGPTVGMIGEAGQDEAVIPLPKNWRNGGGMGGTVINVNINAPVGSSPRDIGRELTKYLNEYERASA